MSTFNKPLDIDPITLAKSSVINDLSSEVSKAFALLPDENELKQGKANYAVDTGSAANSYIVALSNTIKSYEDGLLVSFRPNNSNTGAATINVNSLGAKSIRLTNGDPLSAGDINTGIPIDVRYSIVTGFFHLSPNSAAKSKIAADQASVATTKATEASASAAAAASSASSANSSASSASSSASSANSSASTATTQASAASTSESNAASSASAAATSANNASTSASNALTSATNASTSESNATLWATKVTGEVATGQGYSSKAWAIGGTGVDAIDGSAKDWATKVNAAVGNSSEYSSKEYAVGTTTESAKRHASGTVSTGSAKDWATQLTTEVVSEQGYSAKQYSLNAAISANSATQSAIDAANSASSINATATVSYAIGTGSKSFSVGMGKQFQAGQFVTISDSSNPANFMYGAVTSYSAGLLTVDVTSIGGSGTFSTWNISLSGIQGATGAAGANTTATNVTNTPSGGITSTNVQAALNELDVNKFSRGKMLFLRG